MAIERNWIIKEIKRQSDTGGIVYVSARYQVSETVNDEVIIKGKNIGAVFSPNPDSEDFINFEDLVESDVLQWVWDYTGKKEEIETRIDAEFTDKKTRITNRNTVTSGVPSDWNTPNYKQ